MDARAVQTAGELAAAIALHYGPGPHPDGSPQGVHAGGQMAFDFDAPAPAAPAASSHPTVQTADYRDRPFDHPGIQRLLKELTDDPRTAQEKYDGAASQDLFMLALQETTGQAGLPDVVSEAELRDYVAAGEKELWRGIAGFGPVAGDRAWQFRAGPLYAGMGVYGSGTYTSVDVDLARGYTSGEPAGLLHMTLKRDARVVEFQELEGAMHAKFTQAHADEWLGPKTPRWRIIDKLARDRGRLALLAGYDAIHVPSSANGSGDSFYVILNRTAVRVAAAPGGHP